MADNDNRFKSCTSSGKINSGWFQRIGDVYTSIIYIHTYNIHRITYIHIISDYQMLSDNIQSVQILNTVQGFKEIKLPLGCNSKKRCNRISKQAEI